MISSRDTERLFLQAILSRGIVSLDLAKVLWEKSIAAVNAASGHTLDIPYNAAGWDRFVEKINTSIDKLDLEFRHLHDETTGTEMYALVNRKGDEIAQMATDYTPAEIAFFKAVVEQIMLSPRESYSVSSLAALREISAIKPKPNMSKTQAETVLGSFVAKGWLRKSKRGRYSLSARTLLELGPYLKQTYPDELIECTICMETLTRGVACPTPNCKTRMHYHCFRLFRNNRHACPSCEKAWPQQPTDKSLIPVGEEAVREGDEGKRRVRAGSEEASDDDEDDDDDDEPSQTQPPPTVQKKRLQKRGSKKSDEDMNSDDDNNNEDDRDVKPTQGTRRSSRR